MAVSEEATTWMSRTAMNMPTHIAAKPSHTANGLASPGFNTFPFDSARLGPSGQRRLFLADAPIQHRRIGDGKDNRDQNFAEDQRQDQNLARHDHVVGMTDETIGTA